MSSRRNKHFGRFVAEARTHRHLSISKAAALTQGAISRDWWSKIERGVAEGDRTADTLVALAVGLGLPAEVVAEAYRTAGSRIPPFPYPSKEGERPALERLVELRDELDRAIKEATDT